MDDIQTTNASLAVYLSENTPKDPKRARMSKILKIAFKNELTKRQQECIFMYYVKKKKVPEIAKILSISPSTVYKHISTGIHTLKKVAVYL